MVSSSSKAPARSLFRRISSSTVSDTSGLLIFSSPLPSASGSQTAGETG
ncbi:MAG: hypothetical protein ACD_10C00312G0002, partial [uncultured bacterium]